MYELLLTVLRNPKKTIRLLSVHRISNLLFAHFRQPAYIRKGVIKHYLSVINSLDETSSDAQDSNRLARFTKRDQTVVLVVDHHVPEFDQDAGSRSTMQYLQLLMDHEAHVKFLPDDFQKREPYTSVLERLGIDVLYGEWYQKNWRRWWKENSDSVDIVYLHRPNVALKYIGELGRVHNVKIIYFGHDLHFLRVQRQYDLEHRPVLRREAKRWRNMEFKIMEKSDIVYFASMVEVELAREHFPDKCIRAIPLHVFEPVARPVARFDERQGIFFVGGFRHPPNVDGIKWFADEVLPLISEQLPAVQCVMAGSRIPDEIVDRASKQIVIRGRVSDEELTRLYHSTRVVVVPLRFGAGVKGKVLEAMQHRVPVVTTSIGVEGLPHPLDYISVSDDAREFARKVVELYSDSSKWQELSDKGADIISKHFSAERAMGIVGVDFGLR